MARTSSASWSTSLKKAVTMKSQKPQENRRMNLLFLMTDQQRADSMQHMPNVQKLAESGISFNRAYTPNSICSPARASMMTGLYPSRHGMVDVTHNIEPYRGDLKDGLTMWSHVLKQQGYTLGYFGKWHVER